MEAEDEWACEDYEVECARCGKKLMASQATPEEGDEWECLPCNKIHNRLEALQSKLERIRAVAEDRHDHGEEGWGKCSISGYCLILKIIGPPPTGNT